MTHIYASKVTNIGSDNGLSPGRRQAIIWANAGIWLIQNLGTNFLSFKKCIWKCRLQISGNFASASMC